MYITYTTLIIHIVYVVCTTTTYIFIYFYPITPPNSLQITPFRSPPTPKEAAVLSA